MPSYFSFIACITLLAILASAQPPSNPDPDIYWFTQRFDHFNASDTRIWNQRFLIYDRLWKGDGPVFFTAGGESDCFDGWKHNGFVYKLGKQLGALFILVEHRFYGKSLPFGPVRSYTRENLKKLTLAQAMADFVDVIAYVKKHWGVPKTAPLVAFGGSYAGELVTYMRVAYPNVVHAALAGSAPVNYHPGACSSGAYFEWVTKNFGRKDPECPDLVRRAFSLVNTLSETPAGRAKIGTLMKLCSPLDVGEDALRVFALWVQATYALLSMLDYPWPSPYYGLPAFPLLAACDIMHTPKQPDDDRLLMNFGQSMGLLYNTTGKLQCFNITELFYRCADITGCGGGLDDPNSASWDIQSCSELISNVDTNGVTDMFPAAPFDLDALTQYCQKQWGLTPDPSSAPTKYNFTSSSRIIFSNGLLDPWTPGGVLTADNPDLVPIVMADAAHHLDMYGDDPVHDPDAVVDARVEEEKLLKMWVAEIKKELTHAAKKKQCC